MAFEIGDKVRTKTKGFYNNKVGTVSRIEMAEKGPRYIVYIESMDLNLAFGAHELKAEGITWG